MFVTKNIIQYYQIYKINFDLLVATQAEKKNQKVRSLSLYLIRSTE
jgi:hypothetical protein